MKKKMGLKILSSKNAAADAEHQHFLDRNPNQGYIASVDIPLLKGFMAKFPELYTKEIK